MAERRAQRAADAGLIVPLLSTGAPPLPLSAPLLSEVWRRALEQGSEGAVPPPRRAACVLKLAGDQDVDGEVRPPMSSLLQRDVVDEWRRERRRSCVGGI